MALLQPIRHHLANRLPTARKPAACAVKIEMTAVQNKNTQARNPAKRSRQGRFSRIVNLDSNLGLAVGVTRSHGSTAEQDRIQAAAIAIADQVSRAGGSAQVNRCDQPPAASRARIKLTASSRANTTVEASHCAASSSSDRAENHLVGPYAAQGWRSCARSNANAKQGNRRGKRATDERRIRTCQNHEDDGQESGTAPKVKMQHQMPLLLDPCIHVLHQTNKPAFTNRVIKQSWREIGPSARFILILRYRDRAQSHASQANILSLFGFMAIDHRVITRLP